MKAITVKQPWASLICSGIKDVENRTWKTKFRGRVLVHASAKPAGNLPEVLTAEQANFITCKVEKIPPYTKDMNFSAIIGSVEIVDCVINHDSVWAEKSEFSPFKVDGVDGVENEGLKPIYNWVLANPVLFENPIENVKGKLSFWDYEFDENAYECTNDNPVRHQSCGERYGCIQDCGACDYFELKSEYE